MKNCFYIVILTLCIIVSCTSKIATVSNKDEPIAILKNAAKTKSDTIRIANDSLQYEVIIIDPGFSTWLVSNSYSRGYHSQSYLENKNRIYVSEWNSRVMQPQRYNPNLYEMTINYDSFINYGYEVNYLIYNYMIYFQNTYRQKLDGYVPIR